MQGTRNPLWGGTCAIRPLRTLSLMIVNAVINLPILPVLSLPSCHRHCAAACKQADQARLPILGAKADRPSIRTARTKENRGKQMGRWQKRPHVQIQGRRPQKTVECAPEITYYVVVHSKNLFQTGEIYSAFSPSWASACSVSARLCSDHRHRKEIPSARTPGSRKPPTDQQQMRG